MNENISGAQSFSSIYVQAKISAVPFFPCDIVQEDKIPVLPPKSQEQLPKTLDWQGKIILIGDRKTVCENGVV